MVILSVHELLLKISICERIFRDEYLIDFDEFQGKLCWVI